MAFIVASVILLFPFPPEYKGVSPKDVSESRWMIKRLAALIAILFALFPLLATPAALIFFFTPIPPQRMTAGRIWVAVLAAFAYMIILQLLFPVVN